MVVEYATRLRELGLQRLLPSDLNDFISSADGNFGKLLDSLYFTDYSYSTSFRGFSFTISLVIPKEIVLSLPGLDSFQLVIGYGDSASTIINASIFIGEDDFEFRLDDITVALRFPPYILKPMPLSSGEPTPPYAQIETHKSIVIDRNFDLRLEGYGGLSLKPSMIADSGVVISAEDVMLDLSRTSTLPEIVSAGFDEGFIGIYIGNAKVELPEGFPAAVPEDLILHNCAIGTQGVSGTMEFAYSPTYDSATKTFSGQGAGELFGVPFAMKQVHLKFKQNSFQDSSISGSLLLPFFEEPVDVELGLSLNGQITFKLTSTSGLTTIEKPGLLTLDLNSLELDVTQGIFNVKASGNITPLFGGLDWPSFQIKQITIDSKGNMHLDGGWLDLPQQYGLNFHGFNIEITKMGFGKTEDGGKWIGFSGGLKLVNGLQSGASVEGLRVIWYDDHSGRSPKITLNGIGVEFEIPKALRFKGSVSYNELPGGIHRFDGDIKLELVSLNLQVDGKLVIGSAEDGSTFFAIYLGLELPAGIPLWATGLALYGMAGLFAHEMGPNKGAPPSPLHSSSRVNEQWYENPDGSAGWYKRDPVGITNLKSKWDPHKDAMALGAGVTIGTVTDNGYNFSGKVLMVIVFPGPVLIVEGRANILKERSKLDEDAIFRALAILDNHAGTFLVDLDARYKYGNEGQLIDIRGSVEAFFDFANPDAWHLYLGQKEPREKRIRAQIFKLFEANAYFALDSTALAMGAWVGYSKRWSFGPLRVILEAWIEGNALVSRKPTHFHGDLWIHGKAELAVYRFGVGLMVDAQVAADVFDPFHLIGKFRVAIKLPWPLPKFSIDVKLEWGPTLTPPPLPLSVKEIAIEHFKVTTSWPLPRNKLLLPNYDRGDGFLQERPSVQDQPPDGDIPVVPLDCRPHITFGRSINDDALIGMNAQPLNPVWERIGNPAKNEGPVSVRYGLSEVALEKWVGSAQAHWEPLARKGKTQNPNGIPTLFGSWAPIPNIQDSGAGKNISQVKLWLWSATPFDYSRHSGSTWDEWFSESFDSYPCVADTPDLCYNFEKINPSEQLHSPWRHPDNPKLVISWLAPPTEFVRPQGILIDGLKQALCFPQWATDGVSNEIKIDLPQPAKTVRMAIFINEPFEAIGYDKNGYALPTIVGPGTDPSHIDITGKDIISVIVRKPQSSICIYSICTIFDHNPDEISERQQMARHLVEELARWKQTGNVLEPYTKYRLKIVTTIQTKDFKDPSFNKLRELTEYAYFQTQGAPGITNLKAPIGSPNPEEFNSGLDDLVRYVSQTVPATVPDAGQKPILPRPVYRAYDVGVEFNENYVDLMYRLQRRDLEVYLYNSNNLPVRDVQGRLIILGNRWGRAEDLALTASEEGWVTTINSSDCASVDITTIPHNNTIGTGAVNGQILNADTIYEARLIPLLLHHDFADGMAGWQVYDEAGPSSSWVIRSHDTITGDKASVVSGSKVHLEGSPAPDLSNVDPYIDTIVFDNEVFRPNGRHRILSVDNSAKTVTVDGIVRFAEGSSSSWQIPKLGAVLQKANTGGGTSDRNDPVKPGTILLLAGLDNFATINNSPTSWTNYVLSAYMRSSSENAIGLIFHYKDPSNFYRISIDRQRKYRRLVKVSNGTHKILAEDDFQYIKDNDYLISVEVLDKSIKIQQDGKLIFDIIDNDIGAAAPMGTVGLYCWSNNGARFADVRVDDLRSNAPVAYRFKFTTSKFVNFFHHIHSFQDETWRIELPPSVDISNLAALVDKAVDPTTMPSEDEQRNYDSAITQLVQIIGSNLPSPSNFQVTRIDKDKEAIIFLVEASEPIDWKRTSLDVLYSADHESFLQPPVEVKITDVHFGGIARPNEEYVSLLIRDDTNLNGYQIEYSHIPGPIRELQGDSVLLLDSFENVNKVDLPGHIGQWMIVDKGTTSGPSVWQFSSTRALLQKSLIGGGNSPEYPGTFVVAGNISWTDYRFVVRLGPSSTNHGAVGVMFRYKDPDNYYRFSMDRETGYRRLIKQDAGITTVLWEDHGIFSSDLPITIAIYVVGSRIVGYLNNNDNALFDLFDGTHANGSVGLYCWANPEARFEHVEVRTPSIESYAIFRDNFIHNDKNGFEFFEQGNNYEWVVNNNALQQKANTFTGSSTRSDLDKPGTYALFGNVGWSDAILHVRLQSGNNADDIGVMFRYKDPDNYYRFSMSMSYQYRRLVKKINGKFTLLWEADAIPYDSDHIYELNLVAIGSVLRGYIDGIPLFEINDSDLPSGRAAVYCYLQSAYFYDIDVYPVNGVLFKDWLLEEKFNFLDFDRWTIVDQGDREGPSKWITVNGELEQTSGIYDSRADRPPAEKLGTYILTGDINWTDYLISMTTLSSDPNGDIGVMFRYKDPDNYYRFSMNGNAGYRRLVKKVNGTLTVLWEDTFSLNPQHKYLLAIKCLDTQLTGYLDGARLFNITDESFSGGRIALYCSGNTGSHFSDLHVAGLSWSTFYVFGSEDTLPAGTRVKVLSGNESVYPYAPKEPLSEQRFIALFSEKGQFHLSSNISAIRIRNAQGEIAHARGFTADNNYTAVISKVIRKADGTAFFVILPDTSSIIHSKISKGEYRLKMTYLRDNKSNDPDSLILTQAGSSDPEQVSIDIPWQVLT